MIDNVYIFDDIINKPQQDLLETYFLNNGDLFENGNNVSYLNNSTYLPQGVIIPQKLPKHIDNIIKSIELFTIQRIGKNIIENYRYKINRLKVSDNNVDDKMGMHVDTDREHISIVYYVNDTDGDTHLYDTDLNSISNLNYIIRDKKFEHFTLNKKISPKKGRVVMFNGLTPHHSSYPTLRDRYVINFNSVIKTNPKNLL